MNNEYIPVATASTTYYKPQTEQEMEQMTAQMNAAICFSTNGYFKPVAVCGTQWA